MAKSQGRPTKNDRHKQRSRAKNATRPDKKSARAAATERPSAGKRGRKEAKYEDWNKHDLYERAKQMGIEGRSRMSKEELIQALRDH